MINHALLELTPCLKFSTSCCRKSTFCISLGSAVTFLRWSGQICSQLVSSFLRSLCTKNYWNRFIFDQFIPKNKKGDVIFGTECSFSTVILITARTWCKMNTQSTELHSRCSAFLYSRTNHRKKSDCHVVRCTAAYLFVPFFDVCRHRRCALRASVSWTRCQSNSL